mgnify:FL=1|tara:strand:+ start:515 stop:958 length:444 start_codon:yes stop_codon:yes gene_type:complete
MAFTGNFLCTSFKVELLKGVHNFTNSSGNTFRLALYTNSASFTAATTAYTATNEVAGGSTNITAKGNALTNVTPTSSGTTALVDFSDETFSSVTVSGVRGAMIHNDSASGDPAVAILDFGADKAASSGDFTVVFPTADASNAIIRIA